MLKTKTIKTYKATVLVVELPEGAINPMINMGYLQFRVPNYRNWVTDDILKNPKRLSKYLEAYNEESDYKDARPIRVQDGNWQLLGRLPDITEGQWKDVVDDYDNGYFYYPDGYKDTCDTATESGLSLLQANGVYFDNPYGKDEPVVDEPDIGSQYYGSQLDLALEWNFYQSKVWDKERTYLFTKVE